MWRSPISLRNSSNNACTPSTSPPVGIDHSLSILFSREQEHSEPDDAAKPLTPLKGSGDASYRKVGTNDSTATTSSATDTPSTPLSDLSGGSLHRDSGGGSFFRRKSSRGSEGSSRKSFRRRATAVQRVDTMAAAHLEHYLHPETMPFVASVRSSLPTTSSIVEAGEIKTGKLLGEGDYTKTQLIKDFKFGKFRQGVNPLYGVSEYYHSHGKHNDDSKYALKTLQVKDYGDAANEKGAFETAAERLAHECWYLMALTASSSPCPFILKFRGYYASNGIHQQHIDSLQLITDRLGETLEQRMKTWKMNQLQREQTKAHSQAIFVLDSLKTDLSQPLQRDLNMHKITRKAIDKGEDAQNMSLQVEQYPDDLVALQTNYILQIAHALEFLHRRKIVMRDLRPNTIGFKDFPNHHTIQLFHFGHCQEIPKDKGYLEPEPIAALKTGFLGTSQNQGADNGDDLSSSSHFIRRTYSNHKTIPSSNRIDAKHYRAPESYPLVLPPMEKGSGRDSLRNAHTGGVTVTRTRSNITCVTKTLMVNTTPPNSDDGKTIRYQGYNCKADIYSLMMIYYEMLNENNKPFGRNITSRESHFYRVQSHGLRPSLNKLHFPRTIKAVLEEGWNPVLRERSSAAQVRKRLTIILPVLEGKGLAKATTIGREEIEDVGTSLPARAVALLSPGSNNGWLLAGAHNGWDSVWSQSQSPKRLDPEFVMDTIQAHRFGQAKHKNPKKDSVKMPVIKVKQLTNNVKTRSIKDWVVALKGDMIHSETNERTARALLGLDKEDKKRPVRRASSTK